MTMEEEIAALVARVQAENTIIDSVMSLISGLQAQIKAAAATVTTAPAPLDLSVFTALSAAIDAGAAKLAAAVAANTPAAAPSAEATTVAPS